MSWLYDAEYWVPENHMFKTGHECLEAVPEGGAACGVVSTTTHKKLVEGVRAVAWLNECRCDKAWTERGRHEPNAHCGEMDELLKLVDPQEEYKK